MSVGRVLWAVLSAGLAFGINLQQKVVFTREYDRAEYETKTGQLTLQSPAGVANADAPFPLANVHIVTSDVQHVGKRYEVRELVLRAADDVISTPRFEVFASLPSAPGKDLAGGPHLPTLLRGVELPIAKAGWLGARPSYFVVSRGRPSPIVSGSVRFDELTPAADQRSTYLARGVFRAQVDGPDGVTNLSAKIEAHVVWDAD